MQIPKTFQCPQCGAPVPFHYGQISIECEFCGNTIVVPADWRPPPPTQSFPPPYPPAQATTPVAPTRKMSQPVFEVAESQPARKGRSCSTSFVLVLLLIAASVAVLAFVASRTPFVFQNLFAGGFARLDHTYTVSTDDSALTDAVGVAVDGAGNLSVVTYQGRVVRFGPDGAPMDGWSLEGKDVAVWAMKADSTGNLYITSDGAIHKQNGPRGFEIKSIEVNDVFGLFDLAIAPDGSLVSYLGSKSDQLVRFDPAGSEVARYQNPLSELTDATVLAPWQVRLAVDHAGAIYLLNMDSHYSPVFVYTPEGKYKTRFGAYGEGDGQVQFPQVIAIDSKNRIYIGASGGVKVFDIEGTYLGIVRMPFGGLISGMAFDKNDHLYVVSRTEKDVYRFALNEP